MPTKEINIKKIIEKEKHTLVISSTDEMYNVFDKEIAGKLRDGMLINATYDVKQVGDKTFNNLISFEEIGRKEPVETPIKESDRTPGVANGVVDQTVAVMVEIKDKVEKAFNTNIKDQPEIIPCINSIFIEVSRRTRS